MQIFLTSSTHCSSGGSKTSRSGGFTTTSERQSAHTRAFFANDVGAKPQRGFTLIELLISIGIIAVLTAIVIVKYGSFDSTVLLKSTAYEIGLNIREAQVRSVSASRGNNDEFDRPFGVSFDITNPKQYGLFSDTNNPTVIPPENDGETFQTVEIGRTMQIEALCVTVGDEECSDSYDIQKVDISFKRPEYRSLIYAERSGGSQIANVTDAKIIVSSTRNTSNKFEVVVSQLGQIDVRAITP